jgi:hypothetical protein
MNTPQQNVRDRLHREGAFDSSNSNSSNQGSDGEGFSYILIFLLWLVASLPAKTMISKIFNPSDPFISWITGFIVTYTLYKLLLRKIKSM